MSSFDHWSPQVISRLQKEIGALAKSSPNGCTFVPNEDDDITEILSDIEGPVDTPYEGGTFRVKLVLTGEYPASPPKGYFLTMIYHPNVGPTGDICVNTLKKDWSKNVTLSHVFQIIRCLLIVPFPDSSLNDEAGKLFMDSYDEYAQRAKLLTKLHAMKQLPKEETSLHLVAADSKPFEPDENKESINHRNIQQKDNLEKRSEKRQMQKTKEPRRKAIRRL